MTEQELALLIDFHRTAERQGPGSDTHIRTMLQLLDHDFAPTAQIADIGCGTGSATLVLAQETQAQIMAVDLFPEFLQELEQRARALELHDRITTRSESMENLSFAPESLDLIWSEGAIYIMGFERGVQTWKTFLKPGGYLAVSEIAWITYDRPQEVDAYWQEAYPQIDTISGKIRVLEQNGFTPVAHLVLPPSCWFDHYYGPMEKRFAAFLEKHDHSAAATQLVEQEKQEIAYYQRYKDYYSYGFFLAKKL